MAIHIGPIDPLRQSIESSGVSTPSNAKLQRTVEAGVKAIGGAANYAAQSSVQGQKDAETRKSQSHLIDRKIVTATLAALEPVGTAHDEDEADAEREQLAFGAEAPFGPHKRIKHKKKR